MYAVRVASGGIRRCECCGRGWAPRFTGSSQFCPECKVANSDTQTGTELMRAIAAAFQKSEIRAFLTSLELTNARIRHIADTSSWLGRYLHENRRDTTFHAIFESLDDVARYKVSDFYSDEIHAAGPDLKKEFKRVFRQ